MKDSHDTKTPIILPIAPLPSPIHVILKEYVDDYKRTVQDREDELHHTVDS